MNKNLKTLLILFLLSSAQLFAQDKKPPFWNDIQKFKQKDSISMPAKGGIVFVGSSSFTRWDELETVYKEYNAINRGFGGSTLEQANFYVKDLVFPYEPRQVVIYCGENDIAAGASAMETLKRFSTFFTNIRNKLPEAHVLYVSMKLSPSRTKFADAAVHGNAMIKEYLSHYKNARYVEMNDKMKAADGSLRPELFVKDMLHMNSTGYDIWIKELTPLLLKKQ